MYFKDLFFHKKHLELDHLSLPLLVSTQFEMFATLQGGLLAIFAICAFHTEYDFLGGLSLEWERKFMLVP